MAASLQIKTLVFLFLLCDTIRLICSETEPKKEKEELSAEETKKLEIIKRIKKINDDGSYTIGYEADDGSFKIESRDVLGHIKGTYGFVDQDGQIKRVSYSTTNSTEIISKPPEETLSSVVQRIPSKKQSTTTFAFTSTQSTPLTSTVTSIKRKPISVNEETQKPNYQNVINVANAAPVSKNVAYTPATSKVLIQGKSVANQITKPETVTIMPTESSSHNQFDSVHEKPLEELESDARGNILRRELPQRLISPYDAREHIFTLQQSMGKDAVDVYSSSMTTGTPRPLFTTTARPLRPVLYSSAPTTHTSRTTFPVNYLKNSLQDIESTSRDYQKQEVTTDFPEPTPVSPVQTPAARTDVSEPLVAIRHPNQGNTILVPLSQLQERIIPAEQLRYLSEPPRQYFVQNQNRPVAVEIEQQPAIVRRLPHHHLRPMPVQIDENGYVRELPKQVPVPYPVRIAPVPRYTDEDDDIDNIQPPVSTKDFQRLLQQLIIRQSRLEKINALTRQPPEMLIRPDQQKFRQFYRQPAPSYVHQDPNIHYIQQQQEQMQKYAEAERQQLVPLNNQHSPNIYEDYDSQSYRPNRRVARLLPNNLNRQQQQKEEYLPSDVREMLLLRMLQLAINPALPLDEDEIEVTRSSPVKRTPVRNVEILGEEDSHEKSREQKEKRDTMEY
ncbi:uncharacterized protein LOC130892301 [Diorhabda carinulata]|uniref:uncharacterized protein LOC130892301 n=1 Tax=Diorhabda carinulata TaxID=1163345 RepID=UPI0025A2CFE8|nr:uncharacterized protein LOC130892301 [Diorhabda carinulata]